MFNFYTCKSQTYFDDYLTDVSIKPDSVFEYFVAPNIPEDVLDSAFIGTYISDMKILITLTADTNRKVKHLNKIPLYELSDIPDTSHIWKSVLKSIDSVSKLWVLKPILFKIHEDYDEKTQKYFKELNKDIIEGKYVRRKPFLGRQYHYFILNLRIPAGFDKSDPQFFYWLNINTFKDRK